MKTVGLILSLTACGLIFYQDVRHRLVHLVSILILLTGILIQNPPNSFHYFDTILSNIILLVTYYLVLKIYFAVKKGWKKRLINRYIGLGDVILLIIFCFAYQTVNYIFFVLTSCLLGLSFTALTYLKRSPKLLRIPLAGMMALAHLSLQIYSAIIVINPFEKNLFK